jgi:hypothetical protein
MERDRKAKSFFSGKLELIAIIFMIAGIGLVVLMKLLKKENKRL